MGHDRVCPNAPAEHRWPGWIINRGHHCQAGMDSDRETSARVPEVLIRGYRFRAVCLLGVRFLPYNSTLYRTTCSILTVNRLALVVRSLTVSYTALGAVRAIASVIAIGSVIFGLWGSYTHPVGSHGYCLLGRYVLKDVLCVWCGEYKVY
jgi:hypothetical protein